MQRNEYTQHGLKSLVWLTVRSSLADWIDTQVNEPGIVRGEGQLITKTIRVNACELPKRVLDLAGDLAPVAVELSKGMSKQATADSLGCSRRTIYRQIDRLRERLKPLARV